MDLGKYTFILEVPLDHVEYYGPLSGKEHTVVASDLGLTRPVSPGVLGLATYIQCVLYLIVYSSSLPNRSRSRIAHPQSNFKRESS